MTIKDFVEAVKSLVLKMEEPEQDFVDVSNGGDGVIRFSAGVEAEVEVARSGSFVDMSGTKVDVTPDLMKTLAGSLDLEKHEPKLKLGHEPIKTDTPDYGSVVGLRYDEAKDRLMARIKPTLSLVRKIREGAFNQRSMEFSNPKAGAARFLHLGFLGARRPAISGLAPVALAGAAEAAEVTVLFEEPEPEAPVVEAVPDPAKEIAAAALDSTGKNENGTVEADKTAPKEKTNMADTAKLERIQTRLAAAAKEQVSAFFAANVKRIPNTIIKAGFEAGIVALMAAEDGAEGEPQSVKFAGADGAEKTMTPSAFVLALLAALPEQVTAAETTETPAGADKPVAELPERLAGLEIEPESEKRYLAAQAEIIEEKAKTGKVLDFVEALRRVEAKK